jgi:hypothetical protein
MALISKQVDISAPADQVFALISDPQRLMQLRSDWGIQHPENIGENYPDPDSIFWLRPITEEQVPICVTVMEMLPDQKLALEFDRGAISRLIWTLHASEGGCQLQIEEMLESDSAQVIRQEEEQVQSWLDNIKNFSGLGRSGWQGALRWILERYVLKLRAEQRRIIMMLLALQVITMLTFIAALLGIGLVSLIVSWFRA